MPMNSMTHANATAHTARGWAKNDPDSTGVSWEGADLGGHRLPFGRVTSDLT